jgi:hypothetical protein
MRLHARTFIAPKQGRQADECEDASEYDETCGRFAIADGAGDAFESRLWASALVRAFVSDPPRPDWEGLMRWLVGPTRAWRDGIHWSQLPWYGVEKARRGSYAAFLGVTFLPDSEDRPAERVRIMKWQAIALGDSCLFQIRNDALVTCFPVEACEGFFGNPTLLSTRAEYNIHGLSEFRVAQGECHPDDMMILATDAISAWFLDVINASGKPWHDLLQLTNDDQFRDLVGRLRHERLMHDDDATLILVRAELATQRTAAARHR